MSTRTTHTAWTGTLKEGSGRVELDSAQLTARDVGRLVPDPARRSPESTSPWMRRWA